MMSFPHWLRQPQPWVIDQERRHHEEAVYLVGEHTIFVLLWRIQDHERGLVDRCSVCYDRYSEAYKKASMEKCVNCFGTSFEGYRARIVRPGIWDASDEQDKDARRGALQTAQASVQSTHDFRLRRGDFAFRGDGGRWRVQGTSTSKPKSEFQMSAQVRNAVSTNFAECILEDGSSVAHLIPPDFATLRTRLDVVGHHLPPDMTDLEDIRGPLIVDDLEDPTVPEPDPILEPGPEL
jgi:hypothetical protein